MFEPVKRLNFFYPPLFCRYVKKEKGVLNFFHGDFRDWNSYRERAGSLKEKKFPEAARQLLLEINRGLPGVNFNTLREKVMSNETLFVITGQQPGMLTGPLYVIYKALTALKLARRVEKELNIPVQPLFWVASEDHNIFDMARIFIPVLHTGGPVRIRLSFPGFGPPAGLLPLNRDNIKKVLLRLEDLTPESQQKKEVMKVIRESASLATNFADWFIYLMSALFPAGEMVFLDPLKASKKGLYNSLLLQLVEDASLIHSRISLEEKKLMEKGFPLQVKRTGHEALFMLVWGGRRYALYRDGDLFYTKKGELSFSRAEIVSLIQKEPGLFSPNVLLRPVFQDALYPNLVYVPGPGELAYFAQIKGVYELFGLKMPILFPRIGVTLVEPEIKKLLEESDLTAEEVIEQAQAKPPEGRQDKGDLMKILRDNLWPRNYPQERVFNIFFYLIKYGFSFWEQFCRKFPPEEGHYFYYWEEGV